jgi:hypothetical protein
MEVTIKIINKNAELLAKLDSDKKDHKITVTEYNNLAEDSSSLKTLAGEKSFASWGEFKDAFIRYQQQLGFQWTPLQGQGGPIGLTQITLPAEIGTEIGNLLLAENTAKGNFTAVIEKYLPELTKYLGGRKDLLIINEARDGFKEASKGKEGYRFTPGRNSQRFERAINEYSYKGEEKRQNENEFGELIKEHLQQALELDWLEHVQTGRRAGKYQNVDFEGFKVAKGVTADEFLMYNFELKPSNKISSVSESISQAINYKQEAHFTYIIIPNFNQNSFYNPERFSGFLELCRSNQIGIISIEMDDDSDTVSEVVVVLKAVRSELENIERLANMISPAGWEHCPLCNRIVQKEERIECPWKVADRSDVVRCMKLIMQDKMRE